MVLQNKKRDFFTSIDTPLSSVLCNCFQISCMMPNRSTYCTYSSTAKTAAWMDQLLQHIQQSSIETTFTLRDMVLPGTHDSGSGTISAWKPFSAAGRTQNLSLYEQLQHGIRYLDVRVANGTTGGDDILSIWHGCLEGDNFTNAIQGIADFVQEHTNELIVCEIVPEYSKTFNCNQKRHCLDIVRNTLGADHIVPADQIRDIIETKPFVQVMSNMSQRIIVLLHNRFFEGGDGVAIDMTAEQVAEQYSYGTTEAYLRNPWNDTRNCTELMEKNLTTVQQFVDFRGRLLSNQFVCTPGVSGGISDIIGLFTGKNSLRPVSYACRLYGPNMLDTFFCTHADQSWNIIALDFMDLCPEITDFLITLNWKYVTTMKVLLAAVNVNGTNTDVTSKIQSFLYRSTVLFLTDPISNILDTQGSEGTSSSSFTLTVAYSLTSGTAKISHCVITIDVSGDAPVLISPFGSNEGSMSVCITEDNGTTGVVYRDKIYTTKAEVVDGAPSGTMIEYSIDSSHCQFHMI
jgi:hypothetical protein